MLVITVLMPDNTPMNIAVIGATGKTGREFIKQAIDAGHHIRAAERRPGGITLGANLVPVTCDAQNLDDVTNLLSGCDAVVSLIGHVRGSPDDVQTVAVTNIITAMQKLRIVRIISLTGTGVRLPGDHITITDRILNASIKLIDPKRIQDGILHAKVLQASDLEWTLLRVLKLTNQSADTFVLHDHGPAKVLVPRADVAQAILDVLFRHAHIRQAPIVSRHKDQ